MLVEVETDLRATELAEVARYGVVRGQKGGYDLGSRAASIEALSPLQTPQSNRPAKGGAGIQILVVAAIFALAGLIPLLFFGVRGALGAGWVEPGCQAACRARV